MVFYLALMFFAWPPTLPKKIAPLELHFNWEGIGFEEPLSVPLNRPLGGGVTWQMALRRRIRDPAMVC